jgi:hypothetical protein
VCNSVRYIGREYQSPAQLAELIGGEDHLVWSGFQTHDMNGCLCSVDLEATLKRAGFDWRRALIRWNGLRSRQNKSQTETLPHSHDNTAHL